MGIKRYKIDEFKEISTPRLSAEANNPED